MFVLGLDVGLSDLYARLLDVPTQGPPVAVGGVCVFPNSPAGHQELCAWLQLHSAVPALTTVVMESTGVYWERIAVCLHTAGFAVSVVNGAQIKYFAKSMLLASVPGIGHLTAAVLLSETGHLEDMHRSEQWTAYAGLSPVPRQSGAMVGRCRISKIGNARLRRAMYMAAVTVSRLSNPLGAYYRRLVKQGKPKKVALIALARKLLRLCFAVLKSAQPFDPAYQRPLQTA